MNEIKDDLVEEIKTEEIPQKTLEVQSNPIMSLLELAVTSNLDIEKMERLMQMKKDYDAQQAKLAFNEAMTEFQMKCPVIKKTKEGGATNSGVVAYKYAPIESIVLQTKNLIGECGFSYLIKTEIGEGKVKAICIVKHKNGHFESSELEVPLLRQTGVMSDAQVVAGTTTFAKRYAFCNAFGIMTGDEDNDGSDRESLESALREITSTWKSKDKIIRVALTIESSKTFRSFLSKLPTSDDIKHFEELLLKVDEVKRDALWSMLEESIIAVKWSEFIKNLENTVNKTKLNESKPQINAIETQG